MPGEIVDLVRLHSKKDLQYAAEIVQRDGGKLHIFPDTDSVQIPKGEDELSRAERSTGALVPLPEFSEHNSDTQERLTVGSPGFRFGKTSIR